MMGKLQTAPISASDTKEVLISSADNRHMCEPPDITVVRINTHGPETAALEADQTIMSRQEDNKKRRSVRLERIKPESSWGFTLQSYGIYHTMKKRIENYTYVDYVELKSPAHLAGMKRGDIIFAINGQSTEGLTHEGLVDKIKVCAHSMRMVLVTSDICHKVELHQRRQKLQALLRQKQSELSGLEKREAAVFINVKTRAKEKEIRRMKVLANQDKSSPPPDNHYSSTLLFTENNNNVQVLNSPKADITPQDVRPKQTGVTSHANEKSATATPIKTNTKQPAVSPGKKKKSPAKDKTSPSEDKKRTEAKLRAYMNKLSLTDEPSAYEKTLFAQSRLHSSADSTTLQPSADSKMYRSVRMTKSPLTAADPMYRSMRLSKTLDS